MTCPAKSARTEYGLLDPDQMVSHRQKRVLLDVFCISEVVGPMLNRYWRSRLATGM